MFSNATLESVLLSSEGCIHNLAFISQGFCTGAFVLIIFRLVAFLYGIVSIFQCHMLQPGAVHLNPALQRQQDFLITRVLLPKRCLFYTAAHISVFPLLGSHRELMCFTFLPPWHPLKVPYSHS